MSPLLTMNLAWEGSGRILQDNSINTDKRKSDSRTRRMKFSEIVNAPFRESHKAAGKYTRLADPSAP